MGRHQMPYELVFKRGGETPAEERSWHLSRADAAARAHSEAGRQRRAGFTDVWLAYDLWDHSGAKTKRIEHNVVLQKPA